MVPFKDDIRARSYPLVTLVIIAVNLAVFGYQLTLSPQYVGQLINQYGLLPADLHLSHFSLQLLRLPVALFASMFLHTGWFHLTGNMWFLWIFGDSIEDRMGHVRFMLFYLISGFLTGLAYLLAGTQTSMPLIGASGPVAAVLGAYLVSYPFARVLTLIPLIVVWPVVELPALLVLASWFPLQLLNGAAIVSARAEGIASAQWWIYTSAFLAGMASIGLFARRPLQRYSW